MIKHRHQTSITTSIKLQECKIFKRVSLRTFCRKCTIIITQTKPNHVTPYHFVKLHSILLPSTIYDSASTISRLRKCLLERIAFLVTVIAKLIYNLFSLSFYICYWLNIPCMHGIEDLKFFYKI